MVFNKMALGKIVFQPFEILSVIIFVTIDDQNLRSVDYFSLYFIIIRDEIT